jgi:hypothetical protein
LPLPWENPPPWIQTMTGNAPPDRLSGVDTFSVRQSSLVSSGLTGKAAESGWAQVDP